MNQSQIRKELLEQYKKAKEVGNQDLCVKILEDLYRMYDPVEDLRKAFEENIGIIAGGLSFVGGLGILFIYLSNRRS